MFARSSTIQAEIANIDAGIAYCRDTVMPALSHVPGFVGLSLMVDRPSGLCIATSAWRSEDEMRASDDTVRSIRDEASAVFGGAAEVDEWEVAVMHRAHHARPGTCMRATWSQMPPARVDELIDVFKFGTLDRIEDLPGFCSASLMLNRAAGLACVTVAYDDADALEASRDPAASIRSDALGKIGGEVLDVIEFDLELAHLHIPETV